MNSLIVSSKQLASLPLGGGLRSDMGAQRRRGPPPGSQRTFRCGSWRSGLPKVTPERIRPAMPVRVCLRIGCMDSSPAGGSRRPTWIAVGRRTCKSKSAGFQRILPVSRKQASVPERVQNSVSVAMVPATGWAKSAFQNTRPLSSTSHAEWPFHTSR